MTLTEKIQSEFIGADYQGIEETESVLQRIIGKECKHYDSCIDDGVDEDETEDSYIMRACFSTEDGNIVVHIYYGDVTEEIGYVDVAEPAI
jgi:hypothetical protein